jgi:hydroxymethylpyrimidine pyrophosphatase-like HAD family hydrolase
LTHEQILQLETFLINSSWADDGAVITDLDGTAVHELEKETVIHHSVEVGLKRIYERGRPIIINTLRFPLSVIRTFALGWYNISNAPIPVILLNGSQLGFITKEQNDFAFEQLVSFPLTALELNAVLRTLQIFARDNIKDIILFYYPENWKDGEIIWTPDERRIPHLQAKYRSATSVISTTLDQLANQLLSKPVCMILLLVDLPSDKLMAYQHTGRSNFVTREGVDKLFGTEQMAKLLNFNLSQSVGAGDSSMDTFLNGVGLSVHVKNANLPFNGSAATLKLADFVDLGNLLNHLANGQAVPKQIK